MAAGFREAEFPRTIGFKALGGPTFNTTVNEGFSGFESRNQNWSVARGEWDVNLTTPAEEIVSKQEFVDQLQAFFLIVGGKANGFRLKDHKDFTNGSAAQYFGTGDGVTGTFQLLKTYTSGGYSYVRNIYKPITSSVLDYQGNSLIDTVTVFKGGVGQAKTAAYVGSSGTKYSLDYTTGQVTFRTYTVVNGITSVTNPSGDGVTWVYNYTSTTGGPVAVNRRVKIATGNSANNGTFTITAVDSVALTFSVNNPSGVAEAHSKTGVMYASFLSANITAVSMSGSNATYTYTALTDGDAIAIGERMTITGMGASGNNGIFYVTAIGANTFTVVNAGGSNASTQSGTGYGDWVPASSALLTATYQFHFPVRFDTDQLQIRLEDSNVAGGEPIITWASIKMRELRLASGTQG
jgi:uncharacterized protein (TIGR02217 family)